MQLLKLFKKNGNEKWKDLTLKKMVVTLNIKKILVTKVLFRADMQKLNQTKFFIFMAMPLKFYKEVNFMMLLKNYI